MYMGLCSPYTDSPLILISLQMSQTTTNTTSGTDSLKDIIVEAAASKKAERIALISLATVEGAPVGMMVVCEGRSPTQVSAIADGVSDDVARRLHIHPSATTGRAGAAWIAADYGEMILHVMTPDARARYALEELWSDAEITWIEE